METFKQLLSICKNNSVKVSIFSNIVNLDDELLSYIDNETLYVLFKLDSLKPSVMKYLYGSDKTSAILQNYQRLKEVIHTKDGTTNLGASIVPTSKNYTEIYSIIDYCMDNGIYPLLGQLEDAGKCLRIFRQLALKEKELLSLRNYIEYNYDVHYQISICPATISDIHITNTNQVIVDERSGLSCGWFWLDEPKMITIVNILTMSYEEITKKIIVYRKSKLTDVIALEKGLEANPFGRCGGDAKQLLQQYIQIATYKKKAQMSKIICAFYFLIIKFPIFSII